jgi:hypothetical protein
MNRKSADIGLIRSLDGSRSITLAEFDQMFDDASDEIDQFVDWSGAKRRDEMFKQVRIELPEWIIREVDAEAARLEVPRSVIVRRWLYDRIKANR